MMRLPLLLRAAALAIAIGHSSLSAAADPRTITVTNESLGPIQIMAPERQPDRFVVYISDHDGLTPENMNEVQTIVGRGAAVAVIDLPKLQQKLAGSKDETCYYVFGDVEDLARTAQRELGMTQWRWPIMFGRGDGGTLAYLMLAQAPDNTAGGAVSIGFKPALASERPLCPGAPMTGSANGIISYKPFDEVPGPWVLMSTQPVSSETQSFLDDADDSRSEVIDSGDAAVSAKAIDALFAMSPSSVGGLSDLPLVELPGTGKPTTLFILISGDGGWRDIDKQIGEYLAEKGIAVIGVDSLRYFWSRREPRQVASDLNRIITHYTEKWGVERVGMGGYSFGADVLPLTWSHMPRDAQARTKLIALLGLETTADLQVSVTGFLGIKDSNDIPIAPHLASLPKDKVVCFYGTAEKGDTSCLAPELKGATLVERPGGHHFDGKYEPVADAILARLK